MTPKNKAIALSVILLSVSYLVMAYYTVTNERRAIHDRFEYKRDSINKALNNIMLTSDSIKTKGKTFVKDTTAEPLILNFTSEQTE